jgi:hypothetical protein
MYMLVFVLVSLLFLLLLLTNQKLNAVRGVFTYNPGYVPVTGPRHVHVQDVECTFPPPVLLPYD